MKHPVAVVVLALYLFGISFASTPFSLESDVVADVQLAASDSLDETTGYVTALTGFGGPTPTTVAMFQFNMDGQIPPDSHSNEFVIQFTEAENEVSDCSSAALLKVNLDLSSQWTEAQAGTGVGYNTAPWNTILSVFPASMVSSNQNFLGSIDFGGPIAAASSFNISVDITRLDPVATPIFSVVLYCTQAANLKPLSVQAFGNTGSAVAFLSVDVVVCGDNFHDVGYEECDEGSSPDLNCDYGLQSCQVCNSTCQYQAGFIHVCNDSVTDAPDEDCDPPQDPDCEYGSSAPCDICNTQCKQGEGIPHFCGDGALDDVWGEECDTAGTQLPDCNYNNRSCIDNYCNATTCRIEPSTVGYCGDNILQEGFEDCDADLVAANETECTIYGEPCVFCVACSNVSGTYDRCGDSILQSEFEDCDNGTNPPLICPYGQLSCTVCSSDCEEIPGTPSYCGDGVLDTENGEECDDGGNIDGTNNCDHLCKLEQTTTGTETESSSPGSSQTYIIIGAAAGGGVLLLLLLVLLLVFALRRKKNKKKDESYVHKAPQSSVKQSSQSVEMEKKTKGSSSGSVSYSDNLEAPEE